MTPRLLAIGLLALVACSAGPSLLDSETVDSPVDSVDDTVADTAETGDDTSDSRDSNPDSGHTDDSVDDSADVPVEHVGDDDDPAAWLFTADRVSAVDLGLPPSSVGLLRADPYTYVPADISIDGVVIRNVGVRLKGRIGSYRTLDQKASFRVHFNEYVEDQEFYGLKHLTLNAEVVDPSFLKTYIGYEVYRAVGVPASRAGYSWVTVNGSPFGLYVNVETQDDVWLEKAYPDASGNLYDGKYEWYGGYSYVLIDFDDSSQDYFDLEEGTDVGRADIHAVTAALDAYGDTSTFFAETNELVDWEELWLQVTAEQWVGQIDGYALNKNNYRVYFDPRDGKAEIIPWDLDYAFQEDSAWGMSWASPAGRLYALCRRDGGCRATWRGVMADTCTVADGLDLVAEIDRVAALINGYVEKDPRKEYDTATCFTYQDLMRDWVEGRSNQMRYVWSL